ncbi:MAG: FAD-binding oxidoreductase, partial [Sulfitobacter sp.]|nr:FAD-binding oxidoreductase [Sulfitobacter sp.]
NRSYAAHLRDLSEPSEMLDAQAMQEMTGSTHYRSGLYTPGTLMLQPAGYVQGFAHGLRRAGVRIAEQSPVVRFEKTGRDWKVTTPAAQITAPRLILATNGHLESFGIARGKLIQLFLYASMTPELRPEVLSVLGGADRWGITPSDPMGTTMRRIEGAQGGNRIITRTCATVHPDMQATPRAMRRAANLHKRKFAERFPKLSGMDMEYAWAGHLCLTLNGVSVTSEVADGVVAACVQNGLGTARGTLTGIAAAEITVGKTSDITAYFKAEAAPKPLPPQPFATWGANAYLRWKEHRAGAE